MSENTENPPSNGTATSSSGSTTFTAPGLLTDTTLEVHGRIFHVHSVILKLYSAYFRKFMDSADKQTNPIFPLRYEYVTVVDADNFWGLEAKSKVSFFSHSLHSSIIYSQNTSILKIHPLNFSGIFQITKNSLK